MGAAGALQALAVLAAQLRAAIPTLQEPQAPILPAMAQVALAQVGRQAVAILGQLMVRLRVEVAAVAASTLGALRPAQAHAVKFRLLTPKGE